MSFTGLAMIRIALLRERDETYPLWLPIHLILDWSWMGMFIATLAKRRI